jgi:hypothetical protein
MEDLKNQIVKSIRMYIDARDITGGNIGIKSFDYETDSYIDKLIQFISRNGLNIDYILSQLQGDIINSLENINNQIYSTEQYIVDVINTNTTSLELILDNLNSYMIENNQILNNSLTSINNDLNRLYTKVEPKIIEKIVYKTDYIEVQTTKYVYVDKKENVKPDKVTRIDRGTTKPDNGWTKINNSWSVKTELIGEKPHNYYKYTGQPDYKAIREDEYLKKTGNSPTTLWKPSSDYKGENWDC